MKSYQLILLFLLSFLVFSCTDTLTDMGKNTLSSSDSIIVKGEIFNLTSSTDSVKYITSQPDSFLLGNFDDPKFGSIRADILAQLECPKGFVFHANTVVDSVKIYLGYYSCFGSTSSPMQINIHEMDNATFTYSKPYPSNLNPATYCSKTTPTLLGSHIITAGTNSSTSKSIIYKLDTASYFVKKFKNIDYNSSDAVLYNSFKGIYITSDYGSSTLLNIDRKQVNMVYYFHFPAYNVKNINGKDSTVYVWDRIVFPANNLVRQVNCIQHPDRSSVVINNQVNYLASPANWETKLSIDMSNIRTKLNAGVNGKRLTINRALLRVEVTDTEVDTARHPIVKYLLLVKDTVAGQFFVNKQLPSDTHSVLAAYTTALKPGSTTEYEHYYSFNVAKMIASELETADQVLKLRLIPVAVGATTSSSGTSSISSVKQEYLMGAVTIKSGQNTNSPMRLSILYSGF